MDNYRQIEKYSIEPGVAVEVGTERKHGSTTWLAEYLIGKTDKFFSIDADPLVGSRFKNNKNVTVVGAKAEEWLSNMAEDTKISFAYMDGYDIEVKDHWPRWEDSYRGFGYEDGYTVKMCTMSHLLQSIEISKRAVKGCVVIFDDTILYWCMSTGKGALAVPYLISQGFEVVDSREINPGGFSGYVVLVKQ